MKALFIVACVVFVVVFAILIALSVNFSLGMLDFYQSEGRPYQGLGLFTLWNTGIAYFAYRSLHWLQRQCRR